MDDINAYPTPVIYRNARARPRLPNEDIYRTQALPPGLVGHGRSYSVYFPPVNPTPLENIRESSQSTVNSKGSARTFSSVTGVYGLDMGDQQ